MADRIPPRPFTAVLSEKMVLNDKFHHLRFELRAEQERKEQEKTANQVLLAKIVITPSLEKNVINVMELIYKHVFLLVRKINLLSFPNFGKAS
jgi:hypothetical protein